MEANIEENKEQKQQPAAATSSDWHEVRLDISDDDDNPPPVTLAATSSHKQKQPPYVLRRVPRWVREHNEHAYAPKFICIGPYHAGGSTGNCLRHVEFKRRYADELLEDAEADNKAKRDQLPRICKEKLCEMEDDIRGICLRHVELKRRYADELLKDAEADNKAKRDQLPRICKEKLWEMEDDIRGFYGEGTQDMATCALVKMMFLDGCFIIKHMYNYARGSDDKELYQSTWAPAQLRIDLCLLENQIPFAVLVALFEHLAPQELRLRGADEKTKRGKLLDMALWYTLKGWWPLDAERSPRAELQMAADMPIDHLLHLLHKAHCAQYRVVHERRRGHEKDERRQCLAAAAAGSPFPLMRVLRCMCLCHWEPWPKSAPDSKENIPSAAELTALGIRIKMVKAEVGGAGGLLDVRFRKDRVTLEIPSLYVEQTTAPLLQNLIAYEQQVGTDGSKYPDDYFTTYAFFMYNLVSTREDITLLQKLRILHNNFGSDDKIIEYFKNLCMFNRRSESTPIDDVLQDLRKCKQQKVYRDWAEMMNYINSPVKVLLLIISGMVALSTVLQALVAVRPAKL